LTSGKIGAQDSVSVINEATNAVTATVGVGSLPNSVGVDPSTGSAYVANLDSNSVSVITPMMPPGAPVIGTATAGNASASVSFTAPASDGNSPVTGFTVTAADLTNPANGGQTATGSASPITVTGLTNGDSYTFTVTATNAQGTGPASTASNAVTPVVPPLACTTTITGKHASKLTVASGVTCLVDATQAGQVTVDPGASLSVTDSSVSGTVNATDPASVTYCGSTEAGTLTVTGATGPVILGGTLPDGGACAADTIPSVITVSGASAAAPVSVTGLREAGTLTLDGNAGGVLINGATVSGRISVTDNTAPAAGSVTVSGNTIDGSLACTGNTPAPGDAGAVNTVSGTASGQCTALATR
jgi:YVTN family beta-propeller protein